jgi:hypothetical protein
MMGTTTYCPTKENPGEMMMILHAICKGCFLANDFLFKNLLDDRPCQQIGLQPITPNSIKIP